MKPKIDRILILNYSLNEISYEEVATIAKVMENNLGKTDKLIIMPHPFQLQSMSVKDLQDLRSHIDLILAAKGGTLT